MNFKMRFVTLVRRFKAAQAGAAAVEFALILPVMLGVYMGANEASEMISIDRKVQFVSGAVGDLVAQSRNQILAADLNNYVKISGGLMSPYPTNNLEQIVTQLRVLPDGTGKVVWSRGYLNQAPQSSLNRAVDSIYKLPTEMFPVAKDQYVIMAETRRPTTPLVHFVIKDSITLYRVNFYLPRFGGKIDLK
jgi:Flp pilus assembly protein TadG